MEFGETANNRGAARGFSVAVNGFWPKMVLSPDARKIPPPTRPVLALSRATFASKKIAGFEVSAGEAPPGDFRERDDTTSSVPLVFCVGNTLAESRVSFLRFENLVSVVLELASTVFVGSTTPEGSTILMGTRRRVGTAAGSKAASMSDAGVLDFCSSV